MTRPLAVAFAIPALLAAVHAAPLRADDTGADTVAIARIDGTHARLAVASGRAVLVDVRYPDQRALGHAARDLAVPYDQIAAHAGELPAGKQLIFYCSCSHEEEALAAARAMPDPHDPRLAVLVGGFDAWRRAGGAMAEEASWEGVFRVADPPVGWGKTPTEHGRCRYARDSTVAASGRWSGCVTCGPPDSSSRSLPGFSQRIDVGALRGRIVTLEARVRTEGVTGAALIWLGLEDHRARLISYARSDSIAVIGTQPWRSVGLQIAIPAEAEKLDFGMSMVGAGRSWLDDVTLTAEPGGGRPRTRLVVANPGFEH